MAQVSIKTALVILNPVAGTGDRRRTAFHLRKALSQCGISTDIHETRGRGDAESVARQRAKEYDGMIVAGGDGTINEVAAGIQGMDAVIGIIPLGTGNVLARELGLPLSIGGACKVIAKGNYEQMDAGAARWGSNPSERIFLCMAGAGFDAHVVHQYRQTRGQWRSPLSYVWPILQTFRDFDFSEIRVSVDGKALPKAATSVVVGNVREYGGPFRITPRADRKDGLLDVCAILARSARDMARCVWGTLSGWHTKYPDVVNLTGRQVELASESPVHVHLDGDDVGFLPACFRIVPRAISILVP